MNYFIYCDTRELKEEDEVVVFKEVMPHKDVLHDNENNVPDHERGQMETMRCQASEAHALITDVVRERRSEGECLWRPRSTNPTTWSSR
jgi:hypothetical protein